MIAGRWRRLSLCLLLLPLMVIWIANHRAVRANGATSIPFGFNNQLVDLPGFTSPQVAQAAADIHPGAIVRFTVEWAGIQPVCMGLLGIRASRDNYCMSPGGYYWGGLDTTLDKIASYLSSGRLRLLLVPLNAPQWSWGQFDGPMNPASCGSGIDHPIMPPGDDSKGYNYWRQFMTALIQHVEGRYGKSAVYGTEIWNEEDGCPGWSLSTGPNPGRYAALLSTAYQAVKAVDPTLPVIFGGIGRNPSYLAATYSTRFFGRPDIRAYMTSIGVHPYPNQGVVANWSDPPSDPSGGFQMTLNALANVAATHGDSGRTMSITEFGYPILNPSPTEAQQAQWETDAYNLASSGAWNVNLMLVQTLFDIVSPTGVCRAPIQPRMAASAWKQLLSGNSAAQASC